MEKIKVGVLHPGAMGSSLAAAAQNNGHQVYWVGAGRSEQTAARAAELGLVRVDRLADLCAECHLIVSICPPHAAEDVAGQVASSSFTGVYLDANAIAPQRAQRIGALLGGCGADFVDGGVVGGPAWGPAKTWLQLSGPKAPQVADWLQAGPLVANVLGDEIGRASALKMCFAAYTKGSMALLCAVVAAAEGLGVRTALFEQWDQGGNKAAERVEQVCGVTAKAWRFTGEMGEIASTFEGAGVPGGFHGAAAEIFGRLADFKGKDAPDLQEVLTALLGKDEAS